MNDLWDSYKCNTTAVDLQKNWTVKPRAWLNPSAVAAVAHAAIFVAITSASARITLRSHIDTSTSQALYGYPSCNLFQWRYSGRSHTYGYGLRVNFTRTSSFCAGQKRFCIASGKYPSNQSRGSSTASGLYCTVFHKRTPFCFFS